jgi:hypothetical protein
MTAASKRLIEAEDALPLHIIALPGGIPLQQPANTATSAIGQSDAKDDILTAVAPESSSSPSPPAHGDGSWEPVSFGARALSGKVKIRLADLVKVGPEGYIHGYICVRPPCGHYAEAKREAHGGKTVNVQTGEVIGRDLKKEPDHAGYRIKYFEPGTGGKGVTATGEFATRQDASKAIVLAHNIALTRNKGIGPSIRGKLQHAHDAVLAGDYDSAKMFLAQAESQAGADGDQLIASHALDTRAALSELPQPVAHINASGLDEWEKDLLTPAAPAQPLLPQSVRDAAQKKLFLMKTGHQSQAVKDALTVAGHDILLGNAEQALTHLKQAHDGAVPEPGDNTLERIRGAHNVIAEHLGAQPLPAAPVEPVVHQVPEPVKPKTPTQVSASVRNQLDDVDELVSSFSPMKSHISAAMSALKASDWDAALAHMKSAYDIASGNDNPEVADLIEQAHDNLAEAAGKPSVAEMLDAAEEAESAPEPVPVPVLITKKLPKAKRDAIAGYLADVGGPLGTTATVGTVSQAISKGDLAEAQQRIQALYDNLLDRDDLQDTRNTLARADEILADHLGAKPVQPRTVTHAKELGDQISAAAKLALAIAPGNFNTSAYEKLTDAGTLLSNEKAADTSRQLRRLSQELKNTAKHSYYDKRVVVKQAQDAVKKATQSLAKTHGADLAGQDFAERANGLLNEMSNDKPLWGSSYIYSMAITHITSALSKYSAGDTDGARQRLLMAENTLKTKPYYADIRNQYAEDVTALRKALENRELTTLVAPQVTSPDQLAIRRAGSLSQAEAEHYMATGEAGSTAKVSSYAPASAYKANVARNIADEMNDVSTQDMARAVSGKDNFQRVSGDVVQALARHGTRAVAAFSSTSAGAANRFRVAGDGAAIKHGNSISFALGTIQPASLGMFARGRIGALDKADLTKYGMSDADITMLKALSTGGAYNQDTWLHPDGHITTTLHSTLAAEGPAGAGPDDGSRLLSSAEQAGMARQILTAHLDRVQVEAGKELPATSSLTPEDEHDLRAVLASELVQLWAFTSNDDHIVSLSVQRAAEDEFGIQDAMPWKAINDMVRQRANAYYQQNSTALRRFVRAEYDLTQRELKSAGIYHVMLHRGMQWAKRESVPEWALQPATEGQAVRSMYAPGSIVNLGQKDFRPLSSWSHSTAQAKKFASNDFSNSIRIKASIPAERILSTPRTGNGSLEEREWVVISTPGQAQITQS